MEITFFTKNQKMSSAIKWGLFFGFIHSLSVLSRVVSKGEMDLSGPTKPILIGFAVEFGIGFLFGYLIGKLLNWKRIQPKVRSGK
ncbi:MAG TPA: hypothetical protein VJI96_01705 [Candidatus Andersenbacteria bacterium]|nr:hypothetical protein [Candidatus Andersenbacteria bacterium]